MLRLEQPAYLILLLLIPVFIGVYKWYVDWRARSLEALGETTLLSRSFPLFHVRDLQKRAYLWLAAFVLMVISLANPQGGKKPQKLSIKGVECMIALDVSNSMMADDIKNNRLERARNVIEKLLQQLEGNKMGLVVFAGKAYISVPLTADFSAMRIHLQSLNTNLITTQGTALRDALNGANLAFSNRKSAAKVIVLITDGEDHEGEAVDKAKELEGEGVRIFTVGMGTNEGGKIPIIRNGIWSGNKTDASGNEVISKLNTEVLKEIAAAGKGKFIPFTTEAAVVGQIQKGINGMGKSLMESYDYSQTQSYFWIPLLVAVFLIIYDTYKQNKQ